MNKTLLAALTGWEMPGSLDGSVSIRNISLSGTEDGAVTHR